MGAGTPALAAPPAPARHAPALAEQDDPRWYVVRTSFNGEPEFLYEIAERFLGSGERHNEIFELNRGRLQPDGTRLERPEVITAGWILLLPADAKGDGVQVGPLPEVTATPSAPPTAGAGAAGAPTAGSPAAGSAAAGQGGGSTLPVILLIAAGLLVAGGLAVGVVLLRRRRSGPAARPAAGASARTFDTAAAWTVDRALRALVTGAEAAGRPVPPVYGVSLDDTRIALRLAAPGGEPIEPWIPLENGRVWQAALRDLQALPARADVPSPCPRLVTLGTTGATRELLDLGQADGLISIEGDGSAARKLIADWADELTRSPWADSVRVIAGDVRPHLAASERLTSVGNLRDALTAAEGNPGEAAPSLRGGRPAGAGVLILGSTPGNADMVRVQGLVSRPGAGWAAIVVGQTRLGRWRFTIDADGRLDTGALGITVYNAGVPASA